MTKRNWSVCRVTWLIGMGATMAGCSDYGADEAETLTERGVDVEAGRHRVLALAATAEPPAQCQGQKLESAFRRGWERGKRRVAVVWGEFGECDQVDEFVERVIERVQDLLPERESDRARKRCRYAGVVAGVFDELDVIQQECVEHCFLNGDVVGAIEGKSYCDLVLDAAGEIDPVPWIRAPVGTCGLAFEVGCDARFLTTTRAYSSDLGACLPYTTEPYFEIWDASRLQSCDYDQQDE